MSRFKLYALAEPESGAVRYVGKTEMTLPQRLSCHVRAAKAGRDKSPKGDWIRGLIDSGARPAHVLLWSGDHHDWQAKEREEIAKWRESGADLLNVTDGGNGSYGGHGTLDVDDEFVSMLGVVPDGKIAKAFGVTRKAVSYHRNKMGIHQYEGRVNHKPPPPMGGHNKIEIKPDHIKLLGTMSDSALGRIVGCSKYAIAARRRSMGIQSYAQQTGENGQFNGKGKHPRWGTQLRG